MTDGVIGWEEWATKYKPVDVTYKEVDNYWDAFFDDILKVQQTAINGYHVWTVVDNNPNSVYLDIIPGYRGFNRMGWFITKKIWHDKDLVVSNDKSYY